MSAIVGSVVIPAHNEEAVIRQCLDALLMGFEPHELDVVVVCNGSTDRTAEVARRPGVTVVSLEVASKPAALRAGERCVDAFPRLYLDADVLLPSSAARAVLNCLQTGRRMAARPPIGYATEESSRLVRRYYRARARMPVVMSSLWGAGVYGLSETARARFDEFPDVIADDRFVDSLFGADEIEIVDCLPATVKTPRTSRALVGTLRRVNRGNRELVSHATSTTNSTTRSTLRGVVRSAASSPAAALDASTFIGLATAGRLSSRVVKRVRWERDESSRLG